MHKAYVIAITMTSPEEPTQFTMPQDLYDQVNRAVTENQGMTLEELAAERPSDAYKLLTHIYQGLAESKTSRATMDGVEVSVAMDGQEATSGFARHSVREVLSADPDIEPIDVIVSVFQKPKFKDAVRGHGTKSKQVLSFHVEPPNLA